MVQKLKLKLRSYHFSLPNNPAECSSHLLRGGSLKSRKTPWRGGGIVLLGTKADFMTLISFHGNRYSIECNSPV
jgi:hypothetical protein